MNVDKIKEQAEKEIEFEDFRKAVNKYKEKLRFKKTFFDKIFPYKITIIRKGKLC